MGRVARLRDDFMDFYVKKHGFSIKAWLGPKRLKECYIINIYVKCKCSFVGHLPFDCCMQHQNVSFGLG